MPRPLVLLAAAAGIVCSAPAAALADFTPGAPGSGDPFFPLEGNGGYDVGHYDLRLEWDPATQHLDGTATIRATATQDLSRFDLDLRGFAVAGVTVDRRAATFTRDRQELVITPARGIRSGARIKVVVRYAGTPQPTTDPDGSLDGWIPTDDGAFVANEPQGTPTWFPVNDTPADKATFRFTVTVPTGLWVLANGVLASHTSTGGKDTFVWRERQPMAPYLATVTNGRFDVRISRTASGVREYRAVDPGLGPAPVLDQIEPIVDWFSSLYGPYPFDAVGAIVDDAGFVGYALETQTKPLFPGVPGEGTLSHELSHQWFGDAVTLATWPDIWLHEGFATWSSWSWGEHRGGETTAQIFDELYATPATDLSFWEPPPAAPGQPASLFSGSVYVRGGMTLEALRQKIGTHAFREVLRDWVAQHAYGNATTAGFIALAERVSGQDLTHFFDVWLYQPAKPTGW
jgi:aminopeptidase N